MELVIGTLKSQLVTDNPKLLEVLWDKYGFKVPGYQYTPQYKRKVWDGRKHYFNKKGEFKTGILHRILADLKKVGSSDLIKINSNSVIPKVSVSTVKNYDYRDYQQDAIEHCLNVGRCIVESPVGSGKTLIMAGLIQSIRDSLGCKIVVLFREKGILKQTYDFFKTCGIDSLGVNSGEGYIYGDVMLSTVQSIEKILDTHLEETKVLIVDEAHQFCKGDMSVAAVESFPNAIFRAAFTATVPSEKLDIHGRLTLEGAFGEVYSTVSIEDLIEEGKLAKPIIQIVNNTVSGIDPDISYQDVYETCIVNNVDRNNNIVKVISKINESNNKAKILILVKNLEHVEILRSLISNTGIKTFTIEGKDDLQRRYDLIKKFITSKYTSVIIGTNVLQTGININEITHMINARGLEGEIPTIQGLGRGIRKAEGKSVLYFFDFFDDMPYLKQHSKKRIKHYKQLKFEINYVKL